MVVNEQMKLQQWAADMAEKKSSGLTNRQWCNMKGISTSCFEYRCKRVRDAMQDIADSAGSDNNIVSVSSDISMQKFAKVEIKNSESNPVSKSGIDISFNDINIHIDPDSNSDHVRLVLEVLTNA